MRVVIQRVKNATVIADGIQTAEIGTGLLILVGIEDSDSQSDIDWLTGKIARLRIFDDEKGVMNLSVKDIAGEVCVVSQFTLHASTVKGNRPSYIRAAGREVAIPLYEAFLRSMEKELGRKVPAGVFGADMQIQLTNDGPVTIIIDSHLRE